MAQRFTSRIPLAWLILTHDRRRFFWALLGVSFAVFLMFVQLGFMNGVYDSLTLLISRLDADLFLINRMQRDIIPTWPFPRSRLIQARSFAGVREVYPIYVQLHASWRAMTGVEPRPVRVVAYQPGDAVWTDSELNQLSQRLERPETCLWDTTSRPSYGAVSAGTNAELQGRRIRVAGTFALGPDLVVDGTVLTSTATYESYLNRSRSGRAQLEEVEYGLIKVEAGTDPNTVAIALRRGLPDDVEVLTKQGLIDRVHDFWKENQPVGAVFALGMVFGFLIGVMICYQILFTEIADHLPQYATLKAIGYGDRYLVGTVLRQSVYLAVAAFVAGGLGAAAAYHVIQRLTGLQMWMTPARSSLILGLTVAMCMFAGLIAVRKALQADPAEVF